MIESFVQFNEGKKGKQKKEKKREIINFQFQAFLERIESKQELKIIEFIFN